MIFQHTHGQVMDGTKTQTRRLVAMSTASYSAEGFAYRYDQATLTNVYKPGHGFPLGNYTIQEVYTESGRLKWRGEKSYAVQTGRSKVGIGRIRITAIRLERLQDISEADARAEGVKPYLTRRYIDGPRNYESPFAYREGFRVLWDIVHAKSKIGTRWEDNPLVWVLTFELIDSEDKS